MCTNECHAKLVDFFIARSVLRKHVKDSVEAEHLFAIVLNFYHDKGVAAAKMLYAPLQGMSAALHEISRRTWRASLTFFSARLPVYRLNVFQVWRVALASRNVTTRCLHLGLDGVGGFREGEAQLCLELPGSGQEGVFRALR